MPGVIIPGDIVPGEKPEGVCNAESFGVDSSELKFSYGKLLGLIYFSQIINFSER